MQKGMVKWFSPEKGFGFIELNPETEVFVHHTAITGDGFKILHAGELVEFELIDTSRGYQAREVKRLGLQDQATDTPEESLNPELFRTG